MIDLAGAVRIFLYVLGGCLVFGIMFWLTYYIASQFPSVAPFMGIVRVVLAVLAALVAIGLILSMMGVQVFKV